MNMANDITTQIPENGSFILYTTDDGKSKVALYSRDGRVWLNQNQISDLFATSRPNITMHITNILEEKELEKYEVCKDFLLTGPDGKTYNVQYYSLEMILAVGFRVRNLTLAFGRNNVDQLLKFHNKPVRPQR